MATSISAEELIKVGLTHYEGTFSDGQSANNKLDLSYQRLSVHPKLFRRIVLGLCEIADPYKPEFTVGNPDGATGIAGAVALEMDVYCLHLAKTTDKSIDYATSIDEFSASQLKSGVIIEDVINRRSTTERVLRLPNLAEKISAVIGIFDRGLPGEARHIDKPVHALATLPIEPTIPLNSPIWQLAE